MSKWNLVREYSGGKVADTVEGSYAMANSRRRELEKENGWDDIVIYQTF